MSPTSLMLSYLFIYKIGLLRLMKLRTASVVQHGAGESTD